MNLVGLFFENHEKRVLEFFESTSHLPSNGCSGVVSAAAAEPSVGFP